MSKKELPWDTYMHFHAFRENILIKFYMEWSVKEKYLEYGFQHFNDSFKNIIHDDQEKFVEVLSNYQVNVLPNLTNKAEEEYVTELIKIIQKILQKYG